MRTSKTKKKKSTNQQINKSTEKQTVKERKGIR